MINHYETPEVVEMGRAQDVIFGEKVLAGTRDPETGEPDYDIVLDEE